MEYWHGDHVEWLSEKPDKAVIRVPGLVHESSTLPIGDVSKDKWALVRHDDYRLKGTSNVYVTGGCLWPRGGSWNPTMTMVALAADLATLLTTSDVENGLA